MLFVSDLLYIYYNNIVDSVCGVSILLVFSNTHVQLNNEIMH